LAINLGKFNGVLCRYESPAAPPPALGDTTELPAGFFLFFMNASDQSDLDHLRRELFRRLLHGISGIDVEALIAANDANATAQAVMERARAGDAKALELVHAFLTGQSLPKS